MVLEVGYVLLTKFRLSEVARQRGSTGMHTFELFYIFVLALMTAAYLLSYKLKNLHMFYVEKIFIVAVALYHNRKTDG